MDILQLVDRLEEILNQARPFPFTHNVIVDEDRILDLIDQMRVAIPEEMKKAQQLLAQHDRLSWLRLKNRLTAPWRLPERKANNWLSETQSSRRLRPCRADCRPGSRRCRGHETRSR